MVNRLQQPTHSYLARSRSAMSLSGEQTGNVHTSHMKNPAWLLQSVTSETGFFIFFQVHIKQLIVRLVFMPFIFWSLDQNSFRC